MPWGGQTLEFLCLEVTGRPLDGAKFIAPHPKRGMQICMWEMSHAPVLDPFQVGVIATTRHQIAVYHERALLPKEIRRHRQLQPNDEAPQELRPLPPLLPLACTHIHLNADVGILSNAKHGCRYDDFGHRRQQTVVMTIGVVAVNRVPQ